MVIDSAVGSLIAAALLKSGSWAGDYISAFWKNRKKDFQKNDVAIVVEISQPCVTHVERFLEEQRVNAEIFVISDKKGRQKLPPDRATWEGIVTEFARTVNDIYIKAAPKNLHIFLSAPATLTFAMGCILRTLRAPKVYQFNFDKQTYDLVVTVSDELRDK